MTNVMLHEGKPILNGGAVGTDENCCCGAPPCQCPTLTFINVNIRITFALPWAHPLCITTKPILTVNQAITCVDGLFTVFADIDTDLCDGEGSRHCGSIRIHFVIDGECDCTDTDHCTVSIAGWEEVGCTDGIASVEII